MTSPISTTLFKSLSQRFNTPFRVQKLISSLTYNGECQGETVRSAFEAFRHRTCHCLEGAFLAAAILEHKGYPPLVLSLESIDRLDHILFLFKEKSGFGSIGRSRDLGLEGRAPFFRSPRAIAVSYMDPYVDSLARITGYAIAHLDDSKSPWRYSTRNIWKAENFLIRLKHTPLRSSEVRYRQALYRHQKGLPPVKQPSWW